MASINVTKVVRESIPLRLDAQHGVTIGEQIDNALSVSRDNGSEVQTIAVEFGEGEWFTFCQPITHAQPTTSNSKPMLKRPLDRYPTSKEG